MALVFQSLPNFAAQDLLTYVTANGDLITGTNSTNAAQTNLSVAAVANGANNPTINAAGLVTVWSNAGANIPATLQAAFTQTEAAVATANAAGRSAVFNFGGQSYLFISDGVNGFTNQDVALQLTGITNATTGLTINGNNNISAIA